MASYYEHKRTAKTVVTYQFVCEQCGGQSGAIAADFIEEATRRTNYKQLPQQDNDVLCTQARERLANKLNTAKTDAEKGKYCEEFKDECPHCGKPQSWAVGAKSYNMWVFSILFAIIGGIACLVLNYSKWDITIPFMYGLLIVVGLFLLGMAVGYAGTFVKKMQTRNVAQKQAPTIFWPQG